MTEQEAKDVLEAYMKCEKRKNNLVYEEKCNNDCDNCELCYEKGTVGEHKEAVEMAIKALEEIKQYRTIGTPEECRAAAEKQKEIKPKELKNIYPSGQYECPVCGYCVGKHKYFKSTPLGETLANCKMEFNYCPDCGQKLDWSDEE